MDEKIKQQIVGLIQAAQLGDLKATQTILQIMEKAKLGDKLAVTLALAILTVMLEMQNSTKAAHGAKLNYIKKLSHKCNSDEELFYYKKGGMIDCGCQKKSEGGPVKPNKTTTSKSVDDFKNRKKQDLATKDSIEANVYNDQEIQNMRPGSYKKACGGSMKKKITVSAKGAKVCPKCGKVHTGPCKMSCGSKLKKHLNGGSLIPFIKKIRIKGE